MENIFPKSMRAHRSDILLKSLIGGIEVLVETFELQCQLVVRAMQSQCAQVCAFPQKCFWSDNHPRKPQMAGYDVTFRKVDSFCLWMNCLWIFLVSVCSRLHAQYYWQSCFILIAVESNQQQKAGRQAAEGQIFFRVSTFFLCDLCSYHRLAFKFSLSRFLAKQLISLLLLQQIDNNDTPSPFFAIN